MLNGYLCIGKMMGVNSRPITAKDGKQYVLYDVGIEIRKPNAYGSFDIVTDVFGIPMGPDAQNAANYYQTLLGKVVSATFDFGIRFQKGTDKAFKYVDILSATEYKPEK